MEGSRTSLWIASGNSDKVRELRDFVVQFFPNATVASREPKNLVEDQPTFHGNAKLKAHALARELIADGHQNFFVLGDDSGLCVDLLDGKPGIRSARYAGAHATSKDNLEQVLKDLQAISSNLEKRTGKYHCSLCLVRVSNGKISDEYLGEGTLDGLIGKNPKGPYGYAYDSIFLDPTTLKSYGEIPYDEKQRTSHRQRAFVSLKRSVRNL